MKSIYALWCSSGWSKTRGLMFRRKIIPLILVFSTPSYVSLHSWFVWFAFDVISIDDSWKIIEIKRGMKPWELYSPKVKVSYVLETPVNFLDARLGERVKIIRCA